MIEELQDIEHEIESLTNINCTYDCVHFDNGEDCSENCSVYKEIKRLRKIAVSLL